MEATKFGTEPNETIVPKNQSEPSTSDFNRAYRELAERLNSQESERLSAERKLAEDILKEWMRPIDKTKSCDMKPQLPGTGQLQNTCQLELDSVYPKVKDSIFKVRGEKNETIGSGFYACSDDQKFCVGVTNKHVVDLAYSRQNFSIYQEGVGNSRADVIATDSKNDLALLKIQKPSNPSPYFPETKLKPISWSSAPLQQSDSVFSACQPTAITQSVFVAAGKVEALSQIPKIENVPSSPPSIILSLKNAKGCSGGAVFNATGEFAGVVRAVGNDQTIAIKPEHVKRLIEKQAKKS